MSEKRYIVRLSEEERDELEGLLSKGKAPAIKLLHARILLKADANREGGGRTDAQIVDALETNVAMVYRVRRAFAEQGMEAALCRKKRESAPKPHIFDGEKEAQLIAMACSEPPSGRARWTLRLLADTLVERGIMESVSDTSVYRTLKKTNLSLISRSNG